MGVQVPSPAPQPQFVAIDTPSFTPKYPQLSKSSHRTEFAPYRPQFASQKLSSDDKWHRFLSFKSFFERKSLIYAIIEAGIKLAYNSR